MVSRDIKERRNQKDRFWLRKGEVWVRKTGGREPASAEDLDTMYEGKLRTLVDERVQPLRDRIERLEEDLREQKSVLPELGFGLAVNGAGPSPVGRPYPILDNLIGIGWIRNEIEWAESRHAAAKKAESGHFRSSTLGPSASHYADYKLSLESWLQELKQLLVVDFALINMGHAPAQDVEVVLEVPADLRPRGDLPKRPQRPRDIVLRPQAAPAPRAMLSKQTAPDSLIGPRIRDTSGLGIAQAVWEVGKLYHDRPLLTHSDTNE